jgi:hypothetical protein
MEVELAALGMDVEIAACLAMLVQLDRARSAHIHEVRALFGGEKPFQRPPVWGTNNRSRHG